MARGLSCEGPSWADLTKKEGKQNSEGMKTQLPHRRVRVAPIELESHTVPAANRAFRQAVTITGTVRVCSSTACVRAPIGVRCKLQAGACAEHPRNGQMLRPVKAEAGLSSLGRRTPSPGSQDIRAGS